MVRRILLAPIRPFLHLFRQLSYRALGLNSIIEAHNSSVRQVGPLRTNEIYQRILDRVCLLESHVNWRLLGLPNQLGNVRLEQASALSNNQDLLSVIRAVVERNYNDKEAAWVSENLRTANKALVVGSYNLFGRKREWGDELGACVILQDPDDVTSVSWDAIASAQREMVTAGLLPYLLSLDDKSLDFVWLGNSLQRSAPLHRVLILKNIFRVLRVGGSVAGIAEAKNDIQFQTDVDWDILKTIGFSKDIVTVKNGFFQIKI